MKNPEPPKHVPYTGAAVEVIIPSSHSLTARWQGPAPVTLILSCHVTLGGHQWRRSSAEASTTYVPTVPSACCSSFCGCHLAAVTACGQWASRWELLTSCHLAELLFYLLIDWRSLQLECTLPRTRTATAVAPAAKAEPGTSCILTECYWISSCCCLPPTGPPRRLCYLCRCFYFLQPDQPTGAHAYAHSSAHQAFLGSGIFSVIITGSLYRPPQQDVRLVLELRGRLQGGGAVFG